MNESGCLTMRAMLRNLTATVFCLMLALPGLSLAQSAVAIPALLGTWEGELVRGRENMTLAFTFGQDQGQYTAAITSSALGIFGMPAGSVTVDGNKVNIRIPRLDLEFYGTLRLGADGITIERIDGDYYQSSEMVPVVLKSVANPTY